MHPSEPDPLDRLAAEWREPAPRNPALRRQVWARIAAAEKAQPSRRVTAWFAELRALLRQPATAGFVILCVALGLISAELRATRTPMQDVGRVATTYLQSINPLLRGDTGAKP